jgi:hypothetical protein
VSRRKHKRIKRRIPVELLVGPQRFQAIVLDVSPGGMFVQTSASLESVTEVQVHIEGTHEYPDMIVRARIARIKRVPPRLAGVVSPGMGLQVIDPPPEFEYFGRGEPVPRTEADENLRRFRVRLVDTDGSGYRTVIAEGEDEDDATERLLHDVEGDWTILDIKPV